MKKRKFLVLSLVIFVMVFVLVGCNKIFKNEIYNKSYHVEIDIKEFEQLTQSAIEKAAPAVIGISRYKGIKGFGRLEGHGSGVIYACEAVMKDGSIKECSETFDSNQVATYRYKVITNRHVVLSDKISSGYLKVYIGDKDLYIDAELLKYSKSLDLAIVTFSYENYIQKLDFADSEQIKRGSFVLAIGNPDSYKFYGSATFGIISNTKRFIMEEPYGSLIKSIENEYIQHDVAINPGNSGGALINLEGKLIGIITFKLKSDEIDNMGFAIPSNVVRDFVYSI